MSLTKPSPRFENNILCTRLAALYERRTAIDQLILSLQAYQRAEECASLDRPVLVNAGGTLPARYPSRRATV